MYNAKSIKTPGPWNPPVFRTLLMSKYSEVDFEVYSLSSEALLTFSLLFLP